MTSQLIDRDQDATAVLTDLDISHLVLEDDAPVDSFQSEVQQRLLVEPVYSSKALPMPFLLAANVGLFYQLKGDPIVPDVMLSLGVQRAGDFSQKRNRSYLVWEFGKVPNVCIEIVSNSEGDELSLSRKSQHKGKLRSKRQIYADIGVPYYVVFDPLRQIQGEAEMNGALLRVWTLVSGEYQEITPVEGINEVGQLIWLDTVGLGLTVWQGSFEDDVRRLWLRWCDREGRIIPTGAERAEAEQQRAEMERQRAEVEQQRADTEQQRAEAERQRADQLAEKLRELGLNPDEL